MTANPHPHGTTAWLVVENRRLEAEVERWRSAYASALADAKEYRVAHAQKWEALILAEGARGSALAEAGRMRAALEVARRVLAWDVDEFAVAAIDAVLNPAPAKEHCPLRLAGIPQPRHMPCDAGDFSKDGEP